MSSRIDVQLLTLDRIRTETTRIAVTFFQDGVAMPLTGKTFSMVFALGGATMLTLPDSAFVRTTTNRIEVTLSEAQKTSLSRNQYEVTFRDETLNRTLFEGVFRWLRARKPLAPVLLNPPDIGIRFLTAGTVDVPFLVVQGPKGEPGTLTASALPQANGGDSDLLVAQTSAGALIKTWSLKALGLSPDSSINQPFVPTRLAIGVQGEAGSLLLGGKLSNLLAFGITENRFNAPTVTTTLTATHANTNNVTENNTNIEAVLSGGASGGTVRYEYSFNPGLPNFSRAVYRFFLFTRYSSSSANLSNLQVEWLSTTGWREILNGTPVFNRDLIETPDITENNVPITGLRVTYTIPAGQELRLMEHGLANMRHMLGRYAFAECHRANLFSQPQSFRRIVSDGNAPGLALGTAAGAGAVAWPQGNGNDMAGVIRLTTGASPSSNGVLVNVTFAVPFAVLPKTILLEARNNFAADVRNRVFINNVSTTGFSISCASTALTASLVYDFNYLVIQ